MLVSEMRVQRTGGCLEKPAPAAKFGVCGKFISNLRNVKLSEEILDRIKFL